MGRAAGDPGEVAPRARPAAWRAARRAVGGDDGRRSWRQCAPFLLRWWLRTWHAERRQPKAENPPDGLRNGRRDAVRRRAPSTSTRTRARAGPATRHRSTAAERRLAAPLHGRQREQGVPVVSELQIVPHPVRPNDELGRAGAPWFTTHPAGGRPRPPPAYGQAGRRPRRCPRRARLRQHLRGRGRRRSRDPSTGSRSAALADHSAPAAEPRSASDGSPRSPAAYVTLAGENSRAARRGRGRRRWSCMAFVLPEASSANSPTRRAPRGAVDDSGSRSSRAESSRRRATRLLDASST